MNARRPTDDEAEASRLARELRAAGPDSDPALAAIARLAAGRCGTRMAAVSLVDGQSERFVAAAGPVLPDTQREVAFSAWTLASPGVFIVRDAAGDARFSANPLVAGEAQVRFYAGAPIIVAGHAVGAVCCLDSEAREFDAGAGLALQDLAALAGTVLRQRLRDEHAAAMAHVAKSEFLSRMSHEMRTPLNAVIGFTQLLLSRQDAPGEQEVRDYAEHVLHAGEHLLALTNDVLDLQHVEEGRAELEATDVPLDVLAREVISQLEATAHERGVRFDLQVPEGAVVCADTRRLRQVLHNIASNAVKYNRPAGIVRWSIDADAAPGRVRLSIEDTGSGLKPAQMKRLFQPFDRLGKETSTIEGTGLGLILARSLTVAMGGTLEVASSAGVGTRVMVELPAAQQAKLPFTAPAPTAAPSPPASNACASPALRMLYVEDNRINAILFEEAIRLRDDVELRVAEDSGEALEQVRDWTPDVLVLDAHLPGMDGFELLRALRALPHLHDVPAFMCSADALPDDVQRAASAGFTGYWAKPINIARIMSDLDRLRGGTPPAASGAGQASRR